MREIKFRAWSIKKHKFLNIDTLYCANGKVCAVVEDGVVNDIEDVILEQYTGLKGKNGKEIYEGDIVEYSWDFCGIKRKNKYAVEWFSGEVEHYPYSVDSGFTLPDSVDGYIVVGNIHENPELLEQKG